MYVRIGAQQFDVAIYGMPMLATYDKPEFASEAAHYTSVPHSL
ncbi:hypothetical protein [Mycobacterium stomatepiae]|nr:hypothetical protein [Mycobacterium stomatepiae]